MNVAFFDTKPYDRESFAPLGEAHGLDFKFYETKLTADTARLAEGAQAVCVFVNDTVDRTVIHRLAAQGVQLIALRCAGFNQVDLEAAQGKMRVVRVPAYSPYAVAEHTMALLLCSIRRIHKAYIRTKDFNFSLNGFTGFDLHGKTMGVVGTGKIGRVFIDICKGFGLRILAYDKYPANIEGVRNVSLQTLFSESDVISLHCPLTEASAHMIRKETIDIMKPGVVLLNTSRGALIDSEALLEGIKEKKIGAACLDVYEEESELFFEDRSGHIVQDDTLARLITMPNVIVTSHQGFLTQEALRNIAETTVQNLLDFAAGKPMVNEVCAAGYKS